MSKTHKERRAEAVRQLRGIEYASSLGDPANDNGRTPVEVACGKRLMSYKDECYALIDLMGEDEEPPYDALIRALEKDHGLVVSWDGLRKFWNVERAECQNDLINCGKPYGHGSAVLDAGVIRPIDDGARVKSKGVSEITHLLDTEQENRRSHEGGETTSVSFDPPKVTLVDGDSDLQSYESVSLGPESETTRLETDSREKLEKDVRSHFALWVGGAPRTREAVLGWIDRQAEITKCECVNEASRYHAQLECERDELREKYDGLLDHHGHAVNNLLAQIWHQRNATADMVEQLWHAYDTTQMVNRSLWERWTSCHRKLQNSIELPKDADGETIRLGDVVQYRDEKPFSVTMISYYPNIAGKVFWRVKGAGTPAYGEGCVNELHHYHVPTVEDVLTDFAREFDDIGGAPDEDELWAKLLSKYAEKLRLTRE